MTTTAPKVGEDSATGDDCRGLAPAGEGISHFFWQSRFGAMLIEVQGETTFVNGKRVERLHLGEEMANRPTN